jgi:hypothetical protein
MPLPTVQAAAAKYASRASGEAQYWQTQTAATEVDPTALAAQAAQKAKTNYNTAIDSGRFARALAAAGKTGWLAGVNRQESTTMYANGVNGKGQAKWAKKMDVWFPIFGNLQAQIQGMPKNTPQDSINRVAFWINGTIAAKQNL